MRLRSKGAAGLVTVFYFPNSEVPAPKLVSLTLLATLALLVNLKTVVSFLGDDGQFRWRSWSIGWRFVVIAYKFPADTDMQKMAADIYTIDFITIILKNVQLP